MKVTFQKNVGPHRAGETAEVLDKRGEYLIRVGAAAKEKKAKNEADDAAQVDEQPEESKPRGRKKKDV